MKNVVFLLVSVAVLGLSLGQDTSLDPTKGKCPRRIPYSDLEKPKPCRHEKPFCPEGLICCPCPESGNKYCVRPRDDEVDVDPTDLMGHDGEHYDCHEDHDDDDDDDDDKEETDRVFETDRLADMEEGHTGKKSRHRIRCHRLRMHRILKIVLPVVGLIFVVVIIVIVACCIRRRRMRRAAQQDKQAPYTPGNIAPVGDKSVMKGFLGLDFSPEVFVSSETPYKKLQEENARI
uniref:Uncharacterized protein LOC111121605 n=1 Tax=Crassostrea virginica TaxID=6565 RepID=A0A8B8CS70_CRAVI|nr:uncharacterized protein LOC111121605 [Crassostrea virginica]XP_022318665.1 uncharacterized protein LOC111121605 [Crassostrea virginica]XP_022318666.1 uncharacterized protein LOC111121605 [Crassostrea virginica]